MKTLLVALLIVPCAFLLTACGGGCPDKVTVDIPEIQVQFPDINIIPNDKLEEIAFNEAEYKRYIRLHGEATYTSFAASAPGGEFAVFLQNQSPHFVIAEVEVKFHMDHITNQIITHSAIIGLADSETKEVLFRQFTTPDNSRIRNVEFTVKSILKVFA